MLSAETEADNGFLNAGIVNVDTLSSGNSTFLPTIAVVDSSSSSAIVLTRGDLMTVDSAHGATKDEGNNARSPLKVGPVIATGSRVPVKDKVA